MSFVLGKQVTHPVGMQGMAGASGLGRVVAGFRALLFAIEHFDGGINPEYPGGIEYCVHAAHEMGFEPSFTCGGFNACQSATMASSPEIYAALPRLACLR